MLNQAPRRWSRSQPATGSSAIEAPWTAIAATTTAAPIGSGDIRSHNSGDIRGTGSTIPGPAGRDHLLNSSTGAEHLTSGETTTSRKRSVVLAPAAHVSTLRRIGAFPRRVQDNSKHARTSASALSTFGTIFRSSCRAVRLLPPSPVDIARIQR